MFYKYVYTYINVCIFIFNIIIGKYALMSVYLTPNIANNISPKNISLVLNEFWKINLQI